MSFPLLLEFLPWTCRILYWEHSKASSLEFDTRVFPCYGWQQSRSEQHSLGLSWGGFSFLRNACISLSLLYERKNMGLLVSLFPLTVCSYKNHHLLLRVNIFWEIKLNLSDHIVSNIRLASWVKEFQKKFWFVTHLSVPNSSADDSYSKDLTLLIAWFKAHVIYMKFTSEASEQMLFKMLVKVFLLELLPKSKPELKGGFKVLRASLINICQ